MKTKIYSQFIDQLDQIVEKYGAYTVKHETNNQNPILQTSNKITYKFQNGEEFNAIIKKSLNSIGFESEMPYIKKVQAKHPEFQQIRQELVSLRKNTIKKYKEQK